MSNTPILGLQLWPSGALQPDLVVNDSLYRLDTLVQLSVIDMAHAAPPGSPTDGDRYIVAATATGLWAGKENKVATWSAGAWAFYSPHTGWRVYNAASTSDYVWNGTAWVSAVLSPVGSALPAAKIWVGNVGNVAAAVLLSGDITNDNVGAVTIAAGAVSLPKMANLAANSIIGNNTGAGATPIALTAAQAKGLLAIANTDVSGLGTVATLASDTDGTLAANSDARVATQKATKTYVNAGDAAEAALRVTGDAASVSASAADATTKANAAQSNAQAYADGLVVGLLDDRGNHNASGNTFPTTGGSGTAGAILKGDIWTISVAGTLGGVAVTAGDVIRALVNTPGSTLANWAITEHDFGYVAENSANKDATGGYPGLTLFKLNLRNAANTITSWFTNAATVARTWTLPDKDGTVAMLSDITGTNSGTNTGDETGVRIAALAHAASAKTTPVDADELAGTDSAASYGLIRVTWANIKATLKTYFDTLYPSGSGTSSGTNTGDQSLAGYVPTTRTVNGHALSANVTVTAADVGMGTAGALAVDTDGTLAANSDSNLPSQKAVKTYVATAITGTLKFKGSTDCSANPAYPAASKGDVYIVKERLF